jgi:hypothetical protein
LAHITQDYDEKKRLLAPQEDLTFLLSTRTEVERKLETEKREVQDLATNLYDTWLKIVDIRQK